MRFLQDPRGRAARRAGTGILPALIGEIGTNHPPTDLAGADDATMETIMVHTPQRLLNR
ncbi:MAG: hypothetical protein QOG77_2138 [Solirubrobacteraceae bacterium]|nr:hypothetical protein [Solirubrobacteraceae bacterium]